MLGLGFFFVTISTLSLVLAINLIFFLKFIEKVCFSWCILFEFVSSPNQEAGIGMQVLALMC